jgi:hypothetical protein
MRISASESQSVNFAVDTGENRVMLARLRVDQVETAASPTGVFKIQHATLPNEDEFEDFITFTTITENTTLPFVEIKMNPDSGNGYPEEFSRYVRWSYTNDGGAADITFSIELVLKK